MSRTARPRGGDTARGVPAPAVAPVASILAALLAGVLAARPLLSETFVRVELSFLDPAVLELGPTPAATAVLDSLMLLLSAALLLMTRKALPRFAAIGLGLLAAAVGISTLAAAEPRLALNAGANWLAAAVAVLALLAAPQRRQLVVLLIALLAAGQATSALRCWQQRYLDGPHTLAAFRAWKAQQAERGADIDAPKWVNYERRLISAEAFGYVAHPNVQAACLVAAALAAGGALVGALVGFRALGAAPLLCAAVLAAAPLIALPLTGSRAAMLALAGSAVAAAVGLGLRRFVITRPGVAIGLFCGGYLTLVLGLFVLGLVRGGLPGESLDFRWQYWTAAGRAWLEVPLTGLGRENFAGAYLRHKTPIATEEVRDPHNLWVSLLVETGPLGLIAGGLLLVLALRAATGGFVTAAARTTERPLPPLSRNAAFAAAAAALLTQAAFSGMPLLSPGVGLLWLVETAGLFLLAFLAAVAVARSLLAASGDVWLAAGLLAALVALLLHAVVDITLCTPAGISVLAMVVAAAALVRASGEDASPEPRMPEHASGRLGPGALVGVLAVGHLLACSIPTAIEQARLTEINRWRTRPPAVSAMLDRIRVLADARLSDPLSAEITQRLAESALAVARPPDSAAAWSLAADLAERVARRRPGQLAAMRLMADVWESAAMVVRSDAPPDGGDRTGECGALEKASAAIEAAISGYPSEPRLRIRAARVLAWRAERCEEPAGVGLRAAALAHLDAALAVDGPRKADVAVKLSARELAEIDLLRERLTQR